VLNAEGSIDQYARIIAALEDRFADEARVLAAFGLNRARFLELQQLWSARLIAAGSASELARAFTAAYVEGRRSSQCRACPAQSVSSLEPRCSLDLAHDAGTRRSSRRPSAPEHSPPRLASPAG
jgi:hypothetical protein